MPCAESLLSPTACKGRAVPGPARMEAKLHCEEYGGLGVRGRVRAC